MINDDIKIEGFDSLVKRNKTAIINKDNAEYEAAKLRRMKQLEQQKKNEMIDKLVERTIEQDKRIDAIQDSLSKIIEMLSEKK